MLRDYVEERVVSDKECVQNYPEAPEVSCLPAVAAWLEHLGADVGRTAVTIHQNIRSLMEVGII